MEATQGTTPLISLRFSVLLSETTLRVNVTHGEPLDRPHQLRWAGTDQVAPYRSGSGDRRLDDTGDLRAAGTFSGLPHSTSVWR